ncbi:hypothetical protein MOC97_16045 [Bacillus atrophaeus]|uniref:hypothetical protein n=1 Tax=Bacillus atrophaeus TaxID=1452 RepID=UPI002280F659|nr:hypothetical protein [Bacillus atrophaeus]MCY8486950.1 hypothetical protein [Bacillus atrophaeus]
MRKVIHFVPKAKSIRFFQNIKRDLKEMFGEDLYSIHWKPSAFIEELNKRKDKLDVIIISAHGSNDSIIKLNNGREPSKLITLEEAHLFRNNFIFANSCYTANKFGPALIENGALCYIGFNHLMSEVFKYKNKSNHLLFEKVVKRIYTDSISQAISDFINKCLTAKELCQYIEFYFKKHINVVCKMSLAVLNEEYDTKLDEEDHQIFKLAKLELLEKFNDLKDRLNILGEENYIFWSEINKLSSMKLKQLQKKVEQIKNPLYKNFLKMIICIHLDDQENYRRAVQEFMIIVEKYEYEFIIPFDISKDFNQVKLMVN